MKAIKFILGVPVQFHITFRRPSENVSFVLKVVPVLPYILTLINRVHKFMNRHAASMMIIGRAHLVS